LVPAALVIFLPEVVLKPLLAVVRHNVHIHILKQGVVVALRDTPEVLLSKVLVKQSNDVVISLSLLSPDNLSLLSAVKFASKFSTSFRLDLGELLIKLYLFLSSEHVSRSEVEVDAGSLFLDDLTVEVLIGSHIFIFLKLLHYLLEAE